MVKMANEHLGHDEEAGADDKECADGLSQCRILGQCHGKLLCVSAQFLNRLLHNRSGSGCRGSDCTEHNRCAVIDESHNSSAKRWEAEADEQRCCQSSRGSESGSAFNESSKDKSDDDRLDTSVRVHSVKYALNGGNCAGMLHGVHDEDCAENNYQSADGFQEAVQSPGSGCSEILSPVKESNQNGNCPAERQCRFGRPVKCDHQNDDQQDRYCSY